MCLHMAKNTLKYWTGMSDVVLFAIRKKWNMISDLKNFIICSPHAQSILR
jgi:hypothetical protein